MYFRDFLFLAACLSSMPLVSEPVKQAEIFTSCLRLSSVPAKMLLKLPTFIGFAENQLS